MSALQLGLIVAGIVLVIAVILYNRWQERRLRHRLQGEREPPPAVASRRRVEPTIGAGQHDVPGEAHAAADLPQHDVPAPAAATAERADAQASASAFAIPMDDVVTEVIDVPPAGDTVAASMPAGDPGVASVAATAPDPDIECVVHITPAQPAQRAALATVQDVPIGKPVRWLARSRDGAPWQAMEDMPGPYAEMAACLLLADRKGPPTEAQIAAFLRLASDVAQHVGGAVTAPPAADEARRAHALDRLCAELDIQIGLTIHKPEPGTVPGTRLRGVAEAAGFRLAGGRFEHLHEDTGAVLYTLQNVRNEPLTAESLRLLSVPGVVLLLDVPRVADPARVFDQMKLAARRMAHTLGGELVDDNHRLLDDAALAKIRAQVQAAAAALAQAHIEPGSPRALALFGD
jgi:FtsZ-interacting cell division protein ZipA